MAKKATGRGSYGLVVCFWLVGVAFVFGAVTDVRRMEDMRGGRWKSAPMTGWQRLGIGVGFVAIGTYGLVMRRRQGRHKAPH